MVLRGSFPVTRDEATSRRGSLPAGAICRSLPYASDEICGSGSSCVTQGSPRRGGTTDHRDRATFRVSPVLPVISGAEVIRVLANPAVRHALSLGPRADRVEFNPAARSAASPGSMISLYAP